MKNIVFIGMPGSGKSTISKRVADALKMPWFDSDLEIEAEENMSISDIFDAKGEEYFRELETKCLERLCAGEGAVISVGGGAVLRNRDILRKNGKVVYLSRSVSSIAATLQDDTRPLLRDKNALSRLYDQRHSLYETLSDIVIENEGSIESAVNNTLEALRS